MKKQLKEISYAVIYNRKGRLNKDGKALIQIKAYQNSISKYKTTGIYIEPKYWDNKRQRVKISHPLQIAYNKKIMEQINTLRTFEYKQIQRFGHFSITNWDKIEDVQPDHISFSNYFKEELATRSDLTEGSKRAQGQTINKLLAFRQKVYFDDLNYSFIKQFDTFLRKTLTNQNTIGRHHKNLRIYIHRAIKEDLLNADQNPYRKFKIKSQVPNRNSLTLEELDSIEQLVFSEEHKHLERYRKAFLFGAFSGFRYSDLSRITPNNIRNVGENVEVAILMKKTKKIIHSPIHLLFLDKNGISKPKQILEGVLSEMEVFKGTRNYNSMCLFPMSNQTFNRQLKVIAKLAGINKKVTTHTMRYSFSSNMAALVDTKTIQWLMGHSDERMTLKYIQKSPQRVAKILKKVNW